MKLVNISWTDVVAILGYNIAVLEVFISSLGVCVTAYGVYIASRVFLVYRLQQRSEAAAKALVIVNNFVFYIKEIAMKQGLYESLDYYPDRIPEISLNDKEKYWERPFRLIFNETNKFKKEFGEAVTKIAAKDFSSLNKILSEIEQLAKELSSLLPKKTEDIEDSKEKILKWMKEKQLWFERIDEINNEAKSILIPIINGKSCWTMTFVILVIFSLFVLMHKISKFLIQF